MAKQSQKKAVLKYLQTHKKITSLNAIKLFGATRLSAIIFDLRRNGYNIKTHIRTGKNRFGNTVGYAEYELIP